MAKYGIVKDVFVSVAGVDLSNHCTDFSVSLGADDIPMQAMGDLYKYGVAGLTTVSLTAKFLNDFSSGSVFATLEPLALNRESTVVAFRHDKTAGVGVLNPTYSGLFYISAAPGLIGGTHGSNSEVSVTFNAASNLTKVTA